MNIQIYIIPNSKTVENGVEICLGRIVIGKDFWETIAPALNYWTIQEYQKQWKEGLKRIKTHPTSCLVASIQNPHTSMPYLNRWVLYREKNEIFIHNQMTVADNFFSHFGNEPITPETCYNFIGPRETESEDGWKVSEWVIDFED